MTKRTDVAITNNFPFEFRYSDADIKAIIEAVGFLPNVPIKTHRVSADGASQVEVVVGRHEELARQLNDLAEWDASLRRSPKLRSSWQTVKRLVAIEGAADRLANALHGINIEEVPDSVSVALLIQIDACHRKSDDFANLFPDIVLKKRKLPGDLNYFDPDNELLLTRCVGMIRWLQAVSLAAANRSREKLKRGRTERDARHEGDKAFRLLVWGLKNTYADIFKRAPSISRPKFGGQPRGPFIRFVQAALKPLGITKSAEAISKYLRRDRVQIKGSSGLT